MDKDYAETYKEYKSGKYKYTKGFGKLGCYQGLDYIENILKNDKYYSEDLEDSFIFIQSYIKCIEQQVKKQKEVIDKAIKLIKYNEKYRDGANCCQFVDIVSEMLDPLQSILEQDETTNNAYLKEFEDWLKEVSE